MRQKADAAFDAAVVGGGLSGLVAALALADAGVATLLIAPALTASDRRTTALLGGSVEVLERLKLWPVLVAHAAPLGRLRLVDATQRILRAPETTFDAAELGRAAFGYNVENARLHETLLAAVRAEPRIRLIEEAAAGVAPEPDAVELRLASGARERVRLVVAADGRNSLCRSAAGIDVETQALPQTAIALNLSHSRPHQNVSTEFHTERGPFTLVPLLGNRSSLVCVEEPDEAAALLALDDVGLGRELEQRAHSILGKMKVEGARAAFPLGFAVAERFAARRIALVGEAGHVLPPIGAQGLNLGIRDAAAIAARAAAARRAGGDIGGDPVLDAYDRERRGDIRARAYAVEWMNRSLLSDFLPLHLARGIGLHLAGRVDAFRRFLMREGLGPQAHAPQIERDGGL